MKIECQQPGDSKMQFDQCIEQVRFARAAELARTGNYLEAEAVLAPKGIMPESARELDLLARVVTLQNQFSRAEKIWDVASRKSPGNQDYIEYLECLRNPDPNTDFSKIEKEPDLFETILCYVAVIVSVLGFATIIWAFWPRK
jgi:hypothetical protein